MLCGHSSYTMLKVLVILFLYEVITTNAQECDTDSTIESNLQSLLVSEAGEPPDIDPNTHCNVHMYGLGYDNVLSLLILLQHHL